MKSRLSYLLAALLGLFAALPLLGGGGGGGEGAGGVWVLPRCGNILPPIGRNCTPTNSRASYSIPDVTQDFVMQATNYSGGLVAGMSMSTLGLSGIDVNGSFITVPATLMQQLRVQRLQNFYVLVLDDSCQGYVIEVDFDSTWHSATAYLY